VYISPIWGAKTPGRSEPKFLLVVGVHDIIMPFEFNDDRFRGFWLAEGQILPFPMDFEGRSYNTHTIVWGVICSYNPPALLITFNLITIELPASRMNAGSCKHLIKLMLHDCCRDVTRRWSIGWTAINIRPAASSLSSYYRSQHLLIVWLIVNWLTRSRSTTFDSRLIYFRRV